MSEHTDPTTPATPDRPGSTAAPEGGVEATVVLGGSVATPVEPVPVETVPVTSLPAEPVRAEPMPAEPVPAARPDGEHVVTPAVAGHPGRRNPVVEHVGAGEPVERRPGDPLVTIVLPCYNEGEHVLLEIERITRVMDASPYGYELLCIDDASTDDTLAVLTTAAADYPAIRILAFRRNGGSGTARRIGTQQARGEIVVWTDADMTYENERIPELVEVLLEDETYDQVVGARTTEEGTHKWARVPAKWVIRKIAEWLSRQRIPDLNSGLRSFRRSVALPYLRLLPPGFSCVTTLTLAFLMNQHDIRYVETSYAKRAGTSKFKFFRDAYRYILQVLRMVMYFDPLRVLMPPAIWLVLVGTVKFVVDMVRHPFYVPAGTILLLVSGLLIGSLALLADLLVRSRDAV